MTQNMIPKIQINLPLIDNITEITYTQHFPTIYYFGLKNTILAYDIKNDHWYKFLVPNIEFQYYLQALTLKNGDILLTGGGNSNSVYQVKFLRDKLKISQKQSMKFARKEHAVALLNGQPYVFGGYDGAKNQFLNTCEKYNIQNDEWELICPMNIHKVAFSVATFSNQFIYSFGGYDGHDRLNLIEKYDAHQNCWDILDLKLLQPLSNSAAGTYYSSENNEEQIILLGGGSKDGFSKYVLSLQPKANQWKHLRQIREGRDLRNKITIFNGYIYAIGGNNMNGEKYCFQDNLWAPISDYKHLVKDNLDSWASAYSWFSPHKQDINDEENDLDENEQEQLQEEFQEKINYSNYQFQEEDDADLDVDN